MTGATLPNMRIEDVAELPAFSIRQGWNINVEEWFGTELQLPCDMSNVKVLSVTWTDPDTVTLVLEEGTNLVLPYDALIDVWVFSAWSWANGLAALPTTA